MVSSIDNILTRELTDEQRAAATDQNSEILCLACAGSGKSRTLAYRIACLLANGEPPDGIVAFTFTEKAAETIKRRVSQALIKADISPNVIGAMFIGTIHSYCQNILGTIDPVYRQFDVLDENRLKLYIISRYGELGLATLRPRARGGSYFDAVKQLSNAWKILNDELFNLDDVRMHDPDLGDVLARLSELLWRDQFIDFSLMIRNVVDAFNNEPDSVESIANDVRHLMVDEYQDISPCQEELIRHLHNYTESLFVVGDDDQSIYAWRGADVSNILTFQERYPGAESHTLSDNFRSTPAIVAASDLFVQNELGPSRIEKHPRAVNNKTPRDFRTLWFGEREEEAAWIAERIEILLETEYEDPDGTIRGLTPADFTILMRSTRRPERNGVPRHSYYTQALSEKGLPFSLEAGGGPFERPQVAVLRSTFELLRNHPLTREDTRNRFENNIQPIYQNAVFDELVGVLTEWGRLIHTPPGGVRRRVYPQQLVYDLLKAFHLSESPFSDEIMRDIGLFSQMIQDVETVYMSVDSPRRFREILNFLNNVAETGYDVSTDDILERVDAVTVATVHKAKGLEFPAVFLADIENGRFPGRRSGYEGWLPQQVIQNALDRGAYLNNLNGEARLFYTGLTRAERYLFVTGSEHLPGGRLNRRPSHFANRLEHDELSADIAQSTEGLTHHPRIRRVDETIIPTTFSSIRYYLCCPKDYRFRKGFGFSPPIPDMFGFGQTVHTAIGKLHDEFATNAPSREDAEAITRDIFHLKHVPQSRDPENNPGPYERARDRAVEIVQEYAQLYADDFQRRRQIEARFDIPARDCVISGAIDLLLKEDERGDIIEAEVVEFKTMAGGDSPEDDPELDWTELSVQVQLYAKAAREVLGENARTGAVHLLKDNQRINVKVSDEAIDASLNNIEWAIQGILVEDYPMRPSTKKCANCDFRAICSKNPQEFSSSDDPRLEIQTPYGPQRVRAIDDVDTDD